ncbi:methyl-accepting chemotaxis protein [Seleniivibrio woodruffii]|uniref:methyl-accepting chemotaxis protein n=1 Tax=Seleniivibrio woodruffii TaxID=1078050 RepID=UPI0026EA5783|nr:methyl-accepting chemotaxis protein [Seleniivibrio woodruffii]
MKMSFKMKVLVPVITAVVVAFIAADIFIYNGLKGDIRSIASGSAENLANRYGNELKEDVGSALSVAKTLSDTASMLTSSGAPVSRKEVLDMLEHVLEKNPNLFDVWIVWEPNEYDGKDAELVGTNADGTNEKGQFCPMPYRDKGGIARSFTTSMYESGSVSDWYLKPLKTGKPFIAEPATYSFDGKDIMTVTVSYPFSVNGKVIGVAGADLLLGDVSNMISKIKVYDTGFAFLATNALTVISHNDKEKEGQKLTEPEAAEAIEKGTAISLINKDTFTIYCPVKVDEIDYTYLFGVQIPYSEIFAVLGILKNTIFVIAVLATAIIVIIVLVTINRLVNRLGGEPDVVIDVMQKVADGDFTAEMKVRPDDRTSLVHSVKQMTNSLGEMIKELQDTAETLRTSSADLSSGAVELSAGMTEQSGSTAVIATAATEMTGTTNDIAQNLSNISEFARLTWEKVNTGRTAVEESLTGVMRIKDTVDESSELVTGLGEKSDEINNIVGVISDIADQTNLLALNAAIEAARAGENGRGFAVVADEVRKLAERTQQATTEISSLVSGTRAEVGKVTSSMNGVTKQVSDGVASSERISGILNELEQEISKLQSMVDNISSATHEMAATSDQIYNDIKSVAIISSEVKNTADNIAENSSGLAEISDRLKRSMERFRVK